MLSRVIAFRFRRICASGHPEGGPGSWKMISSAKLRSNGVPVLTLLAMIIAPRKIRKKAPTTGRRYSCGRSSSLESNNAGQEQPVLLGVVQFFHLREMRPDSRISGPLG